MKTLNPNDLGKKLLVEECQKISMNTFSAQLKSKIKETLLLSQIEVLNRNIELTKSDMHFGGVRYWFKCPLCHGRVGTLFVHPISQNVACRGCLGLEYRKRRYKGMVENF